MTSEDIIAMFKGKDSADWEGDNALQGLEIIAKYAPPGTTIICGADHDIIYSVDVDDLAEWGITPEDVTKLVQLNWMLQDESYLACFV